MRCERCGSFATEHAAIMEGGRIRELHLCAACAAATPDVANARDAARLLWPPMPPGNVHAFLRAWMKFTEVHQREPTEAELAALLRHLRKDEGDA